MRGVVRTDLFANVAMQPPAWVETARRAWRVRGVVVMSVFACAVVYVCIHAVGLDSALGWESRDGDKLVLRGSQRKHTQILAVRSARRSFVRLLRGLAPICPPARNHAGPIARHSGSLACVGHRVPRYTLRMSCVLTPIATSSQGG